MVTTPEICRTHHWYLDDNGNCELCDFDVPPMQVVTIRQASARREVWRMTGAVAGVIVIIALGIVWWLVRNGGAG